MPVGRPRGSDDEQVGEDRLARLAAEYLIPTAIDVWSPERWCRRYQRFVTAYHQQKLVNPDIAPKNQLVETCRANFSHWQAYLKDVNREPPKQLEAIASAVGVDPLWIHCGVPRSCTFAGYPRWLHPYMTVYRSGLAALFKAYVGSLIMDGCGPVEVWRDRLSFLAGLEWRGDFPLSLDAGDPASWHRELERWWFITNQEQLDFQRILTDVSLINDVVYGQDIFLTNHREDIQQAWAQLEFAISNASAAPTAGQTALIARIQHVRQRPPMAGIPPTRDAAQETPSGSSSAWLEEKWIREMAADYLFPGNPRLPGANLCRREIRFHAAYAFYSMHLDGRLKYAAIHQLGGIESSQTWKRHLQALVMDAPVRDARHALDGETVDRTQRRRDINDICSELRIHPRWLSEGTPTPTSIEHYPPFLHTHLRVLRHAFITLSKLLIAHEIIDGAGYPLHALLSQVSATITQPFPLQFQRDPVDQWLKAMRRWPFLTEHDQDVVATWFPILDRHLPTNMELNAVFQRRSCDLEDAAQELAAWCSDWLVGVSDAEHHQDPCTRCAQRLLMAIRGSTPDPANRSGA